MPTDKEKAAFAKRLRDLLEPLKIRGGTKLAEQFNLRYHGERPVTPQTAHKWLTGTTIPKPDKLRTLAEWLSVNEHWLHYGPPPGTNARPMARGEKYPATPETIELASKIASLTPKDRNLVEEMIVRFYGEDVEDE
ncbi:XRE family transcriptional regulator [Paraburkholderia sp. Ac-20336]|uniref:XRE family transcriptional regulator n=1 Tax=Burkholderiaceae TaxID=119060 RepID=UPI00142149BB|nr:MULTISPECIES: XRE family transcriptional regulator [Burkholderiaceae]MBN3806960.1 XRE family transcriptional regulator [Paraburkholderia sp. Ac-20336]MBN3851421.1 XRE family transcriptional regulator [Paraburkholderia sp. Ac-20342]NIF56436.1 XRE family transcriptional regulator [Burkholderia sp. Ax-1724]NIF81012.1 XRE family transcriptional regulator [Paraburkholderia sp. Cy-641]